MLTVMAVFKVFFQCFLVSEGQIVLQVITEATSVMILQTEDDNGL